MSYFSDLANSRRSIRKFEDSDIPMEDIKDIIKIAATAPSGCNNQCWRFVAIKNKDVMNKLEKSIIESLYDLIGDKKDKISENHMNSVIKISTFFNKAPVVIAVFMTQYTHSDQAFIDLLKTNGFDDSQIMKLYAHPDLLSLGAAIQNLLLAAHEKGYGACWMNAPAVAGEKINEILNVPKEDIFLSLIPIGIPSYSPRPKKIKDTSEIFSTII